MGYLKEIFSAAVNLPNFHGDVLIDSADITKSARPSGQKYDPNQPRDDHGRFGEGGGTSSADDAIGSESMIIEPSEQDT
jgi:hypothetical protein